MRGRFGIAGVVVMTALAAAPARAGQGAGDARSLYHKSEHRIRMRDGVELFTAVYRPKDESKTYPILMNRTCYSCRPYGEDEYPARVGPSAEMMREGYIVVYQDVRGRYMSGGTFDNMRPHVPGNTGTERVDESSDTYDTIEWLLANVPGHNGKVGMWGISYPGFYTAAALPEAHPALVAASPQAPIADFYFDDFHHQGAYTLSYFLITPVFGYQKEGPTAESWFPMAETETRDAYNFYLQLGALSNSKKYYGDDNFFWKELEAHPDYDQFWKSRNLLPHLKDIHTAVLTVGGWFDAEDLYGPLHIYRKIEDSSPGIANTIIMGPWGHGDWARGNGGPQVVGEISFGSEVGPFFQREVEAKFFRHHLKGEGETGLPEALSFDTGKRVWGHFDHWPPNEVKASKIYLGDGGSVALDAAPGADDRQAFSEYVSDPAHPVPDQEHTRLSMTPRSYMSANQQFASRRPDVLSFQTGPLEEDLTLAGPITAKLWVSTTGTDADWVVKVIDVYPSDTPRVDGTPPGVELGDYEQLVRGEIFRGRYREGFDNPKPFTPGEATEVDVPLQDVYHTFKKGHRLLVHVQSTWFPVFDRNPQTFVPNIFQAKDEDFVTATHRVHHTADRPSHLEVGVIESH